MCTHHMLQLLSSAIIMLHVMIGSVNTTKETMPDTTTPGDQLEAEVIAQSSGNETIDISNIYDETDHSTTHSQNEGSL